MKTILLSCNNKTTQQNSNVAALNKIRLFILAVIFFQVCCHNSYSNKSKDKENKQKDSNFVNERVYSGDGNPTIPQHGNPSFRGMVTPPLAGGFLFG